MTTARPPCWRVTMMASAMTDGHASRLHRDIDALRRNRLDLTGDIASAGINNMRGAEGLASSAAML